MQQLKQAAETLREEMVARVWTVQRGVPTFFDNFLEHLLAELTATEAEHGWDAAPRPDEAFGGPSAVYREHLRWLEQFIARRERERYVSFADRQAISRAGPVRDISNLENLMSQGVGSCLTWKGQPLFKTAFDFALVPMLLWETSPATIFEIGSGTGASALWMADLLRATGRSAHVYSVDINPVTLSYDSVTFLSGDSAAPESLFPDALLRTAPHPWLVIEDAHANVTGVLAHIDRYLTRGDYLFVEDSWLKIEALEQFLAGRSENYRVDSRYTDYFGRNATCAPDSILIRV